MHTPVNAPIIQLELTGARNRPVPVRERLRRARRAAQRAQQRGAGGPRLLREHGAGQRRAPPPAHGGERGGRFVGALHVLRFGGGVVIVMLNGWKCLAHFCLCIYVSVDTASK